MIRLALNNRRESGETIIGLLVTMVISTIIAAGVVSSFRDSLMRSHDLKLVLETRDVARSTAELMAYEIRLAGSGMPLGQGNFLATDLAIGDIALPVLIASDADTITFRRNEKGRWSVLTAILATPGLVATVNSSSGIAQGDTVYISNMMVRGNEGLAGTVSAVTPTTVTLVGGYTASAGASFGIGSHVERVETITFQSPVDDSGIVRDVAGTDVTLGPRTTFSATYLDSNGAVLVLPLTADVITNNLSAIRLDVSVTSAMDLTTGGPYTATVQKTIALRNLTLARS